LVIVSPRLEPSGSQCGSIDNLRDWRYN
jgi:hypothetical protein